MSFDIKASSEDLYNDLFSGFSIISGNRDISSELIYKIRYTALDITDEDINGEINYQYEILGDNKCHLLSNPNNVPMNIFSDIEIEDKYWNLFFQALPCLFFFLRRQKPCTLLKRAIQLFLCLFLMMHP